LVHCGKKNLAPLFETNLAIYGSRSRAIRSYRLVVQVCCDFPPGSLPCRRNCSLPKWKAANERTCNFIVTSWCHVCFYTNNDILKNNRYAKNQVCRYGWVKLVSKKQPKQKFFQTNEKTMLTL
jgi:hypothetical protein